MMCSPGEFGIIHITPETSALYSARIKYNVFAALKYEV